MIAGGPRSRFDALVVMETEPFALLFLNSLRPIPFELLGRSLAGAGIGRCFFGAMTLATTSFRRFVSSISIATDRAISAADRIAK